jgi:hypothetical protein
LQTRRAGRAIDKNSGSHDNLNRRSKAKRLLAPRGRAKKRARLNAAVIVVVRWRLLRKS